MCAAFHNELPMCLRAPTLLCLWQLAQGELAMQYEEAMRTAGVSSLDDALKDMASGSAPALEVNEYNMTLGRTKLYVTDITRPRLIRFALRHLPAELHLLSDFCEEPLARASQRFTVDAAMLFESGMALQEESQQAACL